MPTKQDQILFHLPVTKQWLEQYVLTHFHLGESYRDVLYSMDILLDLSRSIGYCHNIIHAGSDKSKAIEKHEDFSKINISANDEIYDHNKPILTSVCTHSLYCPLLVKKEDRSAETWAQELKSLIAKGYSPKNVILDGLSSLNKGHQLALENTKIIYDTFHILKDANDLVRFAKNKLKSSKTNVNAIEERLNKAKNPSKIKKFNSQKRLAEKQFKQALSTYNTIATLSSWLQHDLLTVAGYNFKTRMELMEFIIEELSKIDSNYSHRINKFKNTLKNNKTRILGFVIELENELNLYASEINCDVYWLWTICYAQRYDKSHPKYYSYVKSAQKRLKHQFYQTEQTVIAIIDSIEKASSVVENLNGRIRKHLRNHVHLNQETLNLFRFIINHKAFQRSRVNHRTGKTPSEILNQQTHQHWLEMLGYKLFRQAA